MKPIENQLSERLYAALELAFKLHGRDSRKSGKIQQIAHLLSVCVMVQVESDDEDQAIAALLHDALEDEPAEISRAEIREKFGEHVLQIIEVSSDTPPDFTGGEKPDWDVRKTAYIAHVRKTKPALLHVSIADKVDNARSILADHRRFGEEVWKRFNRGKEKQIWYSQKLPGLLKKRGMRVI